MNAQDIQRMIDQTEYWDVNILDFKTAFFGDEAFLYIYNDATSCWKVCFSSCYEVKYRTDADRRKIPFVKIWKNLSWDIMGKISQLRMPMWLDFIKLQWICLS